MKVILNTEQLKNCLNYTSKITESGKKGGGSPLYSQIQFDFKNNILIFSAYDSSYGIQVIYGAIEYPDSRYLVDAESLSHLVRYSDSETLEFDFKETRLEVKDGDSSYKFSYYGTESDLSYIFSTIKSFRNPILKIAPEEFDKISKFLSPCSANDAARSFLNGVRYDGNFVATDGNVCGLYLGDPIKSDTLFIISEGLDLISSLPVGKDVFIYKVNNINLVVCENIKIVIPQIEGSFPSYGKIIDQTASYPYEFSVNKNKFQRIVEKLVPFADAHQRLVASLMFSSSGTATILASSEGTKEGQEITSSIEAISPKEDITFQLNIKILSNLVRSLPTEILYIKYSDNTKAPLLLTDKNKYYHILSVYSFIEK